MWWHEQLHSFDTDWKIQHRHGCAACLPLAPPCSYHISTLKQVCGKQSGTAQFLSPTELLCHLCVCNVNRWIRQQGSVGNGEWRQNRAEQSSLDDVLSKIWVRVCVLHLPACVLGDHRINVYTHTERHDRQLVTAKPHYASNAYTDMSNTEKSNTHTTKTHTYCVLMVKRYYQNAQC